LYAPASAPVLNWLSKLRKIFHSFSFLRAGGLFEKNERKILRILDFAESEGGSSIFAFLFLYFWPPLTQTHPFAGGKIGTPFCFAGSDIA
jgi:hypothetical protein